MTLNDVKSQFTEAAVRGLDYIETHPGLRFTFQLSEVRETVPSYIFFFQPVTEPAKDVLALMREIVPHQPGSAGESWRQAFNTFIDYARERNFVTEDDGRMLLTVESPRTIPVLRPLSYKNQ